MAEFAKKVFATKRYMTALLKATRLFLKYGLLAFQVKIQAGRDYSEITPEPTSSSPSYHAANCPGVMPRWGASKRM